MSGAADPGSLQCINSIDRALLNEGLLDEASAVPNIRLFFKHKIQAVDFDNKTMVVHDAQGANDVTITFDFCIGADGSYSVIRRQLMRVVRFVPWTLIFFGFIFLMAVASAAWIFIRNISHTSIWNLKCRQEQTEMAILPFF